MKSTVTYGAQTLKIDKNLKYGWKWIFEEIGEMLKIINIRNYVRGGRMNIRNPAYDYMV